MDVLDVILIKPHTQLYAYGTGTLENEPRNVTGIIVVNHLSSKCAARYGAPLPLFLWPSTVFALLASYLLLIKVIGPHCMATRKPYNLRAFMLFYNAMQCATNLFIFVWVSVERSNRLGDGS